MAHLTWEVRAGVLSESEKQGLEAWTGKENWECSTFSSIVQCLKGIRYRHTHEKQTKKHRHRFFFQKLLSITGLLEFIILLLTSEEYVELMPIQAEHSERFRMG